MHGKLNVSVDDGFVIVSNVLDQHEIFGVITYSLLDFFKIKNSTK